MSSFTITINNNGLVADQVSNIRQSVEKAIMHLDSLIDWQGTVDIVVEIKTHEQAIIEDYAARYNGDTSQYPDGFLPSILDFTGSGPNQKTVALQESVTGTDANGAGPDAGFTIYLGQDGTIKNFGRPAHFDSGTDYTQHDPVPAGTFDFAGVALHEILHGFGFAINSGFFSSFLTTQNGTPTFNSTDVSALLGTGIPFQPNADHYGEFQTGPVQSGIMFRFGNYEQNRLDIGLGDLALLKSMGHNVTNTAALPLFDTIDQFDRNGTASSEVLNGTINSESFFGLGGNDKINLRPTSASSGTDFVDGGTGTDTVVYSGNQSDYQILQQNGYTVVRDNSSGVDGADLLTNVEFLKFDDATVTLMEPLPFWTTDKPSTELVAATYQFFSDKIPQAAGFEFLISSPSNSTDLNDPFYAQFNQENRYFNFANNLGSIGEGKQAFTQEYGALSFEQTVRSAFEKIIGSPAVNQSGGNAEASIQFFLNAENFYQAVAQERIVPAGVALDQATKVVAIGSILNEANKSDIGTYATAIDAFSGEVQMTGTSSHLGMDLFAMA